MLYHCASSGISLQHVCPLTLKLAKWLEDTYMKQHYIPQFYLRGFADARNQVWAYRRNTNTEPYKANVKDICIEKNLYEIALSNKPGKYIERGSAEKALSQIERLFAPSVKVLREFNPSNPAIKTEDLWQHLSIVCAFISNLIVRNPHRVQHCRGQAEALTKKLIAADFFSPADLYELDSLGYASHLSELVELGIQHSELFSIEEGSSMEKLTRRFSEMSHALLKAPSDCEFITSSAPFVAEWVSEDDEYPDSVYFPLSPSSALLFKQESKPEFFYSDIDEGNIIKLNHALLASQNLWEVAIARNREALISSFRWL